MLFIIGLPKAISNRIKDEATTNGIEIGCILADVTPSGKLQLVPFETDLIYSVETYINSLENLEDGNVLVLPYALISSKMKVELETLTDLGGTVTFIKGKQDGWPRFNGSPDQSFLDHLLKAFETYYFPKKPPTPSEYFTSLSVANPRLLITSGSLDCCDRVAPQRRKFIIKCADAFVELLCSNGQIGTVLKGYFEVRSLDHAQSGGIKTHLCLVRTGQNVYSETRQTHIKQGDNTKPQAAARVYYHALLLDELGYVGLLYAGPHPSNDISRTHYLTP